MVLHRQHHPSIQRARPHFFQHRHRVSNPRLNPARSGTVFAKSKHAPRHLAASSLGHFDQERQQLLRRTPFGIKSRRRRTHRQRPNMQLNAGIPSHLAHGGKVRGRMIFVNIQIRKQQSINLLAGRIGDKLGSFPPERTQRKVVESKFKPRGGRRCGCGGGWFWLCSQGGSHGGGGGGGHAGSLNESATGSDVHG